MENPREIVGVYIKEKLLIYTTCCGCETPILVDPERAHSIRTPNNPEIRQAICPDCFDRWNDIHRTSKGLEPLPFHEDAYYDLSIVDEEAQRLAER